jgi:zinc protease
VRNELSIIGRFDQPLTFGYKNQQIQALTREQIKAAMNPPSQGRRLGQRDRRA